MSDDDNFVLKGPPPLVPIADISLGELIYRSLSSNVKQQPALVNGHTGESLAFSTLLEETCSLAEALRNTGYGLGSVVAISCPNTFEFFTVVIASLYIGATVAPINHNYTPKELAHILNISRPKIIFCSKDILDKYKKIRERITSIERLVVIDSNESTTEESSLKDFIHCNTLGNVSRILTTPVNIEEDVAFILSSSGTSGLPKGVELTHRNINTIVIALSDPRFHEPNPRIFCVLPFFHGFGLSITLVSIILNNTTVFLKSFEPNLFLKCIEDHKVTKLFLIPPLVQILVKTPSLQYDLSSVKEVICGAAPMEKSTEEEFKKRLNLNNIRQGYGLTEAVSAICISQSDFSKLKPGSTGNVLPYLKLVIRDPQTGAFLGPNKRGEICIKGPSVMKGYRGNIEATRNSFSQDGWLLTGDIGYYDEDECIFITGRIKELIKYNGYQVAPSEIEGLLLTHPEIIDCGVVGLPNEKAGEFPVAFVVLQKNSRLTQTNIQNIVKNALSPQKWLRGGVIFVDEIPKNPTGKILRRELQSMLKKYKCNL